MSDFAQSDRALDRYVSEINRYSLLSREQEVSLAETLRATGSKKASDCLIVSNLRFVVKTAHEYRGYGLKLIDLIQEGNIGLMIAVRKFDPDKGYRLVSYAVWWIRAYIQSFIMRTWSLVKVGTTQAQRKLFFRLRSQRERADRLAGPGERATVEEIAEQLHVQAREVSDMEMRLGERDFSLDAKVVEGSRHAHLDMVPSAQETQDVSYAKTELRARLQSTISQTQGGLNEKEEYVITHRILCEEPPTLQEIGQTLGISRERVRQIEGNVIKKLRVAMGNSAEVAA